ncbi:hypothetical protein, partial [Thiolapillus sp.]|uniref:hypothetical protein n=1 Tax=Thiolapillus sp. TaxID=2017437 RepID=UPI003AF6D2D2
WFDDNTCVGHINDRSDYELQGTDRGDPKLGPLQNNGGLADKRVFGLVIDFGTSQSPKSTRPLTTYLCPSRPGHQALRNNFASSLLLRTWLPYDWTPRSEAYFVFPLAQGTPGKQCGLAATGVYQPSLRSPWLAAIAHALL